MKILLLKSEKYIEISFTFHSFASPWILNRSLLRRILWFSYATPHISATKYARNNFFFPVFVTVWLIDYKSIAYSILNINLKISRLNAINLYLPWNVSKDHFKEYHCEIYTVQEMISYAKNIVLHVKVKRNNCWLLKSRQII